MLARDGYLYTVRALEKLFFGLDDYGDPLAISEFALQRMIRRIL